MRRSFLRGDGSASTSLQATPVCRRIKTTKPRVSPFPETGRKPRHGLRYHCSRASNAVSPIDAGTRLSRPFLSAMLRLPARSALGFFGRKIKIGCFSRHTPAREQPDGKDVAAVISAGARQTPLPWCSRRSAHLGVSGIRSDFSAGGLAHEPDRGVWWCPRKGAIRRTRPSGSAAVTRCSTASGRLLTRCLRPRPLRNEPKECDQEEGFDPSKIPDPLTFENLAAAHGRIASVPRSRLSHWPAESLSYLSNSSANLAGTARFEPPKPLSTAKLMPITLPFLLKRGPPEPPDVVAASYTILSFRTSPMCP